jgi:hypothetical protein
MPNTMEEGGEDLYDGWKVEEHFRCLRCHLMKQDCFAVSDSLSPCWPTLAHFGLLCAF